MTKEQRNALRAAAHRKATREGDRDLADHLERLAADLNHAISKAAKGSRDAA